MITHYEDKIFNFYIQHSSSLNIYKRNKSNDKSHEVTENFLIKKREKIKTRIEEFLCVQEGVKHKKRVIKKSDKKVSGQKQF